MPRSLEVGPDHLVIDGETFGLAEVVEVHWRVKTTNARGSYLDNSYWFRVRHGERVVQYGISPRPGDEALVDTFHRAVALLDSVVCSRIAAEVAARLRAGDTVTLGPAGARIELTAAGFRLKKPFSKPVPWDRVGGTELDGGRVFLLVDGRRHSRVPLEGENVAVLPHLVGALSPPAH